MRRKFFRYVCVYILMCMCCHTFFAKIFFFNFASILLVVRSVSAMQMWPSARSCDRAFIKRQRLLSKQTQSCSLPTTMATDRLWRIRNWKVNEIYAFISVCILLVRAHAKYMELIEKPQAVSGERKGTRLPNIQFHQKIVALFFLKML